MEPEFIDNFLGKKNFDELQSLLMGERMPWYYRPIIDYADDVNKFQFVHNFYENMTSFLFCEKLSPILQIIEATAIIRIKANLLTITPEIVENTYHNDVANYDYSGDKKEKLKNLTTAIFYVNTNNCYTKFEDGTIVESVANRMVFFSTDMRHTGTSCTDEKTRVVINFNYFK